jgi:hypothetical protein
MLRNTDKTYHVVSDPDGGWKVRKTGAARASKHFVTKKDAISWGRKLSKKRKYEFVIHKKDGTIERKESHGNNPLSPEA